MLNKIIFLGLDGATWKQLDKFLADGLMPNLSSIIQNGVRGDLRSYFPFTSKSCWITMLTGTNAGKHGVPHHGIKEISEVPLVWKILSDYNIKSTVINELVTYPPIKTNGIMITGGYTTPSTTKNFVHPPALLAEINSVVGSYIPSLDHTKFDDLKEGHFEAAYKKWHDHDEKIIKTALYLAEKHEWQVLSVMLENPDMLHHFFWEKTPFLQKFYQWLDSILGNFYALAKSHNANLIIVSDHGSGPQEKHFLVNNWLRNSGFTEFKKPSLVRKGLSKTKIKRDKVRRTLSSLHLKKITSKLTPGVIKKMIPLEANETEFIDEISSQVFSEAYNAISVNMDKEHGYEKTRNEILKKLLEIEDNGKKVVLDAVKREDVFNGPYVNRAADIQLLLNVGYGCTTTIRDKHYLLTREEFDGQILQGDHRPEGIIIAVGPKIAKRKKLGNSPILWDICPTLLHILDIPIPSYMDGKVIKDIFDSNSELFKKQVSIQEKSLDELDKSKNIVSYTEEEEKIIEKNLREMGYI